MKQLTKLLVLLGVLWNSGCGDGATITAPNGTAPTPPAEGAFRWDDIGIATGSGPVPCEGEPLAAPGGGGDRGKSAGKGEGRGATAAPALDDCIIDDSQSLCPQTAPVEAWWHSGTLWYIHYGTGIRTQSRRFFTQYTASVSTLNGPPWHIMTVRGDVSNWQCIFPGPLPLSNVIILEEGWYFKPRIDLPIIS